ncbi:hypothetical protein [Paraburkholderia bonniea]|uniref:hypothetical protein n=1 Tax=Paraburkholderia bonniea TaxID=2152891 RepID=UPI001291C2EA|nr:hypothetical protein [Paraburkholderia bonniea]
MKSGNGIICLDGPGFDGGRLNSISSNLPGDILSIFENYSKISSWSAHLYPGITHLDISFCQLAEWPGEWGERLISLDLSENPGAQIPSGLTVNFVKLNMACSSIAKAPGSWFRNFQQLNLSRNQLIELDCRPFQKLTMLDLSDHLLAKVPGFLPKNLVALNFNLTKVSELGDGCFSHLVKLKNLAKFLRISFFGE